MADLHDNVNTMNDREDLQPNCGDGKSEITDENLLSQNKKCLHLSTKLETKSDSSDWSAVNQSKTPLHSSHLEGSSHIEKTERIHKQKNDSENVEELINVDKQMNVDGAYVEVNDMNIKETTTMPMERQMSQIAEESEFVDFMESVELNGDKRDNVDVHCDAIIVEGNDDAVRNVKDVEMDEEKQLLDASISTKTTRPRLFNPIYRLSLKLAPSLVAMGDVPDADKHRKVDKSGYLKKLCGRGFPSLQPCWRRKFFVLSKGHLYYYESEQGRAADKSCGVLRLEYFDKVLQAPHKECKKATNVFMLTAHDRSFFDPGRHLFSADTVTDMSDWMQRLKEALANSRNNRRPRKTAEEGLRRKQSSDKDPAAQGGDSARRRRRSRESASNGITSSSSTFEGASPSPHLEEVLRGLNGSHLMGGTKVPEQRMSSVSAVVGSAEGEGEKLESITKHRVRGPRGRRAPRSRLQVLQAKQRASSMSALQGCDTAEAEVLRENRPWLNHSVDAFGHHQEQHLCPNTSHPTLAYSYSSDEDEQEVPVVAVDDRESSPAESVASLHMDDLDDLLMNRSLYLGEGGATSSGETPYASPRPQGQHSPEESETSTCRNPDGGGTLGGNGEMGDSLLGLTSAVAHTQRHVLNLDHRLQRFEDDLCARVGALEEETCSTGKTVSSLKATVQGLQEDAHRLTEALAMLSREAGRASRELHQRSKDAEQLNRLATEALQEAQRTRAEQDESRREYEVLVREFQALIGSVKSCLVNTHLTEDSEAQMSSLERKRRSKTDNVKALDTIASTQISVPEVSSPSSPKNEKHPPPPVATKESKPSGYSFFLRPTSLIMGWTPKVIADRFAAKEDTDKNVNKDKQRKSDKGSAGEKYDKLQKHEKTDKIEKTDKLQRKTEKPDRNDKVQKHEKEFSHKRHQSSTQTESMQKGRDKVRKRTSKTPHSAGEANKALSNASLIDIPMMDEGDVNPSSQQRPIGVSHVTINIASGSHALDSRLLKAASSPSVVSKGSSGQITRPTSLGVESGECISEHSSLDSPELPFTITPKDPTSETSTGSYHKVPHSHHRHPPPIPAIPLPPALPPKRPGVFAISRQSSSPNLPLQRQSSAPSFPLQRQHSLGTVPEDSLLLPRQASLMSVPEERPIVDQTLPLSPTPSMTSFPALSPTASVNIFPVSPSPSSDVLEPRTFRNSMEAVTGPVLSGSSMVLSSPRCLPPFTFENETGEGFVATSSLKKNKTRKTLAQNTNGVVV